MSRGGVSLPSRAGSADRPAGHTLPRGNHRDFWKAQVIADGNAELAEGGLDDGERVATSKRLALLEGYAARDVNVEQVYLRTPTQTYARDQLFVPCSTG